MNKEEERFQKLYEDVKAHKISVSELSNEDLERVKETLIIENEFKMKKIEEIKESNKKLRKEVELSDKLLRLLVAVASEVEDEEFINQELLELEIDDMETIEEYLERRKRERKKEVEARKKEHKKTIEYIKRLCNETTNDEE